MVCYHGICSTSKLILNVLCALVLFIGCDSKNWIFFSGKCSFSSRHTRRGHSRPESETRLSDAGPSNTSGAAARPSWWILSSLPHRTIPLVSCRRHSGVLPPAAAGRTQSGNISTHAQRRQHVLSPYFHLNLTFALLQNSPPRSFIPLLSPHFVNQLVRNSADVGSRADCRAEVFPGQRPDFTTAEAGETFIMFRQRVFVLCALSADRYPSFAPNLWEVQSWRILQL